MSRGQLVAYLLIVTVAVLGFALDARQTKADDRELCRSQREGRDILAAALADDRDFVAEAFGEFAFSREYVALKERRIAEIDHALPCEDEGLANLLDR